MNTILLSSAILGGMGLIAGIVLVIAYKKLKVEEDSRIEEITALLPGINCGACGYASCHDYAVNIVEKGAKPGACAPSGDGVSEKISEIVGVAVSAGEKKKAVVKCFTKERKMSALYVGRQDCSSANQLGGGMLCKEGCLGLGDCAAVCPFDAIKMLPSGTAYTDYDRCTGCGICVASCPRKIIELVAPREDKCVYVGCSNTQPAKETRQTCSSGCIACLLCVKKGPEGMFTINNNLSAVVSQPDTSFSLEQIKCAPGCIYELSAGSKSKS